jgi:putative colanic acid biosynthesis acetyltransferase WcaF
MTVDLDKYNNSDYDPGAGWLKRAMWYATNAVIINSWLIPSSGFKILLLRVFGARIGHDVTIKPRVNIKYPWFLSIGDNTWIGENVWIDNLAIVDIGSNVCISQGAYLLTGNHDYKDPHFRLIVEKIVIEDGAWIGAMAVVTPGVTVSRETVVGVGGILHRDSEPSCIYHGNGVTRVRQRKFRQ